MYISLTPFHPLSPLPSPLSPLPSPLSPLPSPLSPLPSPLSPQYLSAHLILLIQGITYLLYQIFQQGLLGSLKWDVADKFPHYIK